MSSPGTEASTATQLIDALLDGSEPVHEGGFTLDPVAAVAKMKAFQYADRSRYLIPIVEALHGLGATRISIIGEGVDFTVQASAVDLPDPSRSLFELYTCAIGLTREGPGRALARLAVGVDMGLGHGSIERIVISHCTHEATFTAEYREGKAPRIVRGAPGPMGRLQVFVDRPWSDTFATGGTATSELDHLRKAVRHSPRPITINNKAVSQHARKLWGERRGESEHGYRYELGLAAEGEAGSEIELWTEGIEVDRLEGPGIGFRAAIHLEAPRRDLSQMKIVRSELVDQAVAQIEIEREAVLAELDEADKTWSYNRPKAWPEDRVDRVLGRPERAPEIEVDESMGRVGKGLFAVPFYVAGIGCGAAAVGMLVSGQALGLFMAIFFFSHGGIGAKKLSEALNPDPHGQEKLFKGLLVLGTVLAVVFGLGSRGLPL